MTKRLMIFLGLVLLLCVVPGRGEEVFSLDATAQRRALDWLAGKGVSIDAAWVSDMGLAQDGCLVVVIKGDGKMRSVFEIPRELYRELGGQPATTPSSAERNPQEGRILFITHSTAGATAVYPGGLAVALEGESGSVIAGVTLMTLGGSLYASYRFSSSRELGYGKVVLMNYGGELGISYPVLAGMIVEANSEGEYAEEVSAWGWMVGFPLGISGE